MPDCIAIIPARYSSARLPGKPLKKIGDKTIIQHVYENIGSTKFFSKVIVATDDKRISDAVKKFGGEVFISNKKHKSGSDRIAEVAKNFKTELIVNIQADEFNLSKGILSDLINEFKNQEIQVATPIFLLESKKMIFDPNQVKVAINKNNYALYFSRSVIPYNRSDETVNYWGHIGVYAYRRETLQKFSALGQSMLERTEKLEQLRLLENAIMIKTVKTEYSGISIDTPEDLEQAKRIYNKTN